MPTDRYDWTLLTLAAAEGRPLTPVQLQKTLFLVGKGLPEDVSSDYYVFKAYDYGPFDAQIYSDAERLALLGYVTIDRSGRWQQYAATAHGLSQAEKVKQQVGQRAAAFIGDTVAWVLSLTFTDLLRSIYSRYPEYQVNSVFRG